MGCILAHRQGIGAVWGRIRDMGKSKAKSNSTGGNGNAGKRVDGSAVGWVIIRLFLGGFFLFSVYTILSDRASFEKTLQVATANGGLFVQHNFIPVYPWLLSKYVATHVQLVSWLVIIGEMAVGGLLVFGLFTRLAALVGLVMNAGFLLATCHLALNPDPSLAAVGCFSLTGNAAFLAMECAVLASAPGRFLGLDAVLFKGK